MVLLTVLMPNIVSINRTLDNTPGAFQPFSQENSSVFWDLSRGKNFFTRIGGAVTCTLVFCLKEFFLTSLLINGIHMLNTLAQEISLHFLMKSGVCLMSSLAPDLHNLLSVRGENTKAFTKPISLSAVSCILWPFNFIIVNWTKPLINAIISWLYIDLIKCLCHGLTTATSTQPLAHSLTCGSAERIRRLKAGELMGWDRDIW